MATTSLSPISATEYACGCIHTHAGDALGSMVGAVKCGAHTIVPSEALAAWDALSAPGAGLEDWEDKLLATLEVRTLAVR